MFRKQILVPFTCLLLLLPGVNAQAGNCLSAAKKGLQGFLHLFEGLNEFLDEQGDKDHIVTISGGGKEGLLGLVEFFALDEQTPKLTSITQSLKQIDESSGSDPFNLKQLAKIFKLSGSIFDQLVGDPEDQVKKLTSSSKGKVNLVLSEGSIFTDDKPDQAFSDALDLLNEKGRYFAKIDSRQCDWKEDKPGIFKCDKEYYPFIVIDGYGRDMTAAWIEATDGVECEVEPSPLEGMQGGDVARLIRSDSRNQAYMLDGYTYYYIDGREIGYGYTVECTRSKGKIQVQPLTKLDQATKYGENSRVFLWENKG